MKRILLSIAAILAVCLPVLGQKKPSVEWEVVSRQVEKSLYEFQATGTVRSGWHIYDLEAYNDGPNETVFILSGEGIEAEGPATITSPVVRAFSEVFGMEIGTCDSPVTIVQRIRTQDNASGAVQVHIEWQACNEEIGACLPPEEFETTLTLEGFVPGQAVQNKLSAVAPTGNEDLWALILEAILWGLLMLLTPCVFPMVPMTVSFFLKRSETPAKGRFNALMYGIFIVLLYTLPICLIIGITWMAGGEAVSADIFNWLSTHWLPNLIFFVVFMVFAASFFGAFEIVLPSKWTNSVDQKGDRGGLGGVFFLALALVLVSFSCTGPIVGTVLIKSTQGEFWTPMVTMLSFSIAFALPFALLAFFPSLLKKLPKSGGWLNSVKVVLGFVEIALGLKFLSVADQTYHWGLLDREVYLAIWIVCFTLLGFYLLGKIRFKYDSPVEHISFGRLALVIIDFAFVVYMIPGMWGAPLKSLSGYLPPLESQDFVLRPGLPGQARIIEGEHMIAMPHGLVGYDNLESGLEAAKKQGKKVFVDFTGHGCVNCREMEARVWSDPAVLQRLSDNFILVALYMDDKQKLPESEWVTTEQGKVLKDVGRVNSHLAQTRFGVNSQPNYLILSPDGTVLAGPRGYNLDVAGFVDFLDLKQ